MKTRRRGLKRGGRRGGSTFWNSLETLRSKMPSLPFRRNTTKGKTPHNGHSPYKSSKDVEVPAAKHGNHNNYFYFTGSNLRVLDDNESVAYETVRKFVENSNPHPVKVSIKINKSHKESHTFYIDHNGIFYIQKPPDNKDETTDSNYIIVDLIRHYPHPLKVTKKFNNPDRTDIEREVHLNQHGEIVHDAHHHDPPSRLLEEF